MIYEETEAGGHVKQLKLSEIIKKLGEEDELFTFMPLIKK